MSELFDAISQLLDVILGSKKRPILWLMGLILAAAAVMVLLVILYQRIHRYG